MRLVLAASGALALLAVPSVKASLTQWAGSITSGNYSNLGSSGLFDNAVVSYSGSLVPEDEAVPFEIECVLMW